MTMQNGGEKPNAIVDRAAAPCPDDVGTQIRDMCLNQRFSLSELPGSRNVCRVGEG